MILNFQKNWKDGTPTNFERKIWASLLQEEKATVADAAAHFGFDDEGRAAYLYDLKPKLHTIRPDVGGRWEAERPIHFKQWEGRPYHTRNLPIAPEMPVTTVQKLEIRYHNGELTAMLVDGEPLWLAEYCEDPELMQIQAENLHTLAVNDGFASVAAFLSYPAFSKDFTGKIIHWTKTFY